MKTLVAFSTALMLLTAIPAAAMSCCGGGKGKGAAMCGKGDMTMNHGGRKSGEMSCCCEGMAGKMSKRA